MEARFRNSLHDMKAYLHVKVRNTEVSLRIKLHCAKVSLYYKFLAVDLCINMIVLFYLIRTRGNEGLLPRDDI